jgi:4-hydroxy-2-oxovalerate/4-hydroxy-2-oxohexanoate aldolase
MDLRGKKITVHDMCLRDGMHPKRHQITVAEMVDIAKAMDEAGIPMIEVTHGDGLGGASVNYGFPAASDEEYLTAVCKEMKNTKVSALLLPGIGTDKVGFLMMAHMIEADELVAQLKLMEGFGADCVYITDSAGYMLPDDVSARVALARAELKPETELGFHGHHNLAMGIANSLAAVEAGANRIDGSLAGLGAGAGNTPLEVFIAVCERMGVETGVDLFKAMDIAEDKIVPMMDHLVRVDRDSLTLGYAGVYSSFLLFAKRSAEKYKLSTRDILVELGRRRTVGGQEDMIEDLALDMARAKGTA